MDPIVKDDELPPAPIPRPELIGMIEAFCESTDARSNYLKLVRLIRWLQYRGAPDRRGQLRAFIEHLRANDALRARFQARFGEIFRHLRSTSLFAESGIPFDGSLRSEILRRLIGAVLPAARSESDAARLLTTLYSSEREARQFLDMPPAVFEALAGVVAPADAPDFWQQQRHDLCEAVRLLATRAASVGLRPLVRARGIEPSVVHSPFYELVSRSEEVVGSGGRERLASWKAVVARCREEMAAVHKHMETAGVSVELVFDLKKIDACLLRMERLLDVLHAETPRDRILAIRTLLERLIAGRLSDESVRAYLQDNLQLLARKTVERTGRSGEHYIAQTRTEYRQMWIAALGGGLLTVITAALKLRIVEGHLPLFVEGFLAGTNYAVSFVLLQTFHLVLATKQPAATAATFAGIVRDCRGVERSSRIADFVARITRSQLAAAVGNVIAVCLGGVAFEQLYTTLFHRSFLGNETAAHVYEQLHAYASGTAFFAIVTGVLLWLAAMAGGWCENFAVFYRVPEAIEASPLGVRLGRSRMKTIARFIERNAGPWSTSIVLGYLLGFTPVVGDFFGIPLDVRHVTLSTGTLALAATHFGAQSVGDLWLHHAVFGIALIFFLNLSVSFLIAASVALRAYNVGWKEQFEILAHLCKTALRSPLRFVLPVDDARQPAAETRKPDLAADGGGPP